MVVEPGSKPQNLNAYNKLMGYTNERKGEIVYIELEPKFQSLTNVDPEKWTDDESKAKIFRSEGEIEEDLHCHKNSLEKMNKELGIILKVEQVP